MNSSSLSLVSIHWQTLPGVGFGTALLLASAFESPRHLATSALATIARKCGLDEARARAIKGFLTKRNSEM